MRFYQLPRTGFPLHLRSGPYLARRMPLDTGPAPLTCRFLGGCFVSGQDRSACLGAGVCVWNVSGCPMSVSGWSVLLWPQRSLKDRRHLIGWVGFTWKVPTIVMWNCARPIPSRPAQAGRRKRTRGRGRTGRVKTRGRGGGVASVGGSAYALDWLLPCISRVPPCGAPGECAIPDWRRTVEILVLHRLRLHRPFRGKGNGQECGQVPATWATFRSIRDQSEHTVLSGPARALFWLLLVDSCSL